MAKNTKIRTLRVSEAAARSVMSGHPWVYREGLPTIPAGEPVVIESSRGKCVGWGLADQGAIAIRVLSNEGTVDTTVDRILRDRIVRADAWRSRSFGPDTTAYRVINGAGDGLPGLVVDRYETVAVVRSYSAAWERYFETIVRSVSSLPWVESVFRRYGVARVDGRSGGETLYGPEVPDSVVVLENGMRLVSRPYDGQKTGLFLDQREHRRMIRDWAAGRLVANLFSYNGGFSVSAALGGAATVCTVDVAPQAIEDAKENFRLNGLSPNDYEFVVADVFEWEPRSKLDLLIIDPPSMAKTQKAEESARRAYSKLHRRFGVTVSRGGLLATASCTARISRSSWEEAIAQGLKGSGQWVSHWKSHEPIDHPVAISHREGDYLKFALLRRL